MVGRRNLTVAEVPRLPVDVLISWKDYTSADEMSGITGLAVLIRSQKKADRVDSRLWWW